jgi:hypothetical protein
MEWGTPYEDRTGDQSDRARMGQLLRALLPVHVGPIPQTHRRVLGALGNAEVQATERPPQAGLGFPGKRVRTRAGALRSLASGTSLRPDGGSRMSREAHVRFCESRRVRLPPATHRSMPAKEWGRACAVPPTLPSLHRHSQQVVAELRCGVGVLALADAVERTGVDEAAEQDVDVAGGLG